MKHLPAEFATTYSTEAHDHNNWTVTNDVNGHLVGWICKTDSNGFDACRLRYDNTNGLEVLKGLPSLQEAKCFVFNTSSIGGESCT